MMDVKFGENTYQIPDSCLLDAPSKRSLLRSLREHGPASFLASDSLAKYSSCVIEALQDRGVQVVGGSEIENADSAEAVIEIASDEQGGESDGEPGADVSTIHSVLEKPEELDIDPR